MTTQSTRIRTPFHSMAVTSLVMIIAVASCSPAPEPPASTATEAVVNTPSIPDAAPATIPKAVLPDGFEVTIELAITPDELAQGLMFRPSLPDGRGMLLLFEEERLPNIWMMNTLVALDIIYLDATGKVVDLVTDAQPCPAEPCPRFTPKLAARAVLEIPAGGASQHGVVEGLVLAFTDVPNYPLAD